MALKFLVYSSYLVVFTYSDTINDRCTLVDFVHLLSVLNAKLIWQSFCYFHKKGPAKIPKTYPIQVITLASDLKYSYYGVWLSTFSWLDQNVPNVPYPIRIRWSRQSNLATEFDCLEHRMRIGYGTFGTFWPQVLILSWKRAQPNPIINVFQGCIYHIYK